MFADMPETEIKKAMADLDQFQAAKKTDSQLAAWIGTFRSSQPGSPNYGMLQACIAEQCRRRGQVA